MRIKITSKGAILYLTRSRRIRRLNKIAGLERKSKLLKLGWKSTLNGCIWAKFVFTTISYIYYISYMNDYSKTVRLEV